MSDIQTKRVTLPAYGAFRSSALPLPDTHTTPWYRRVVVAARVAWRTLFAADREIAILLKWLADG